MPDAPTDDDLLATYLTYLTEEKRLAPASVDNYGGDIRRLRAHLQATGVTLATATSEHVTDWLKAMRAGGMAQNSVNRKISSARGLFRFLCVGRHRADDPAQDIRSSRASRRVHDAAISTTLDALLAAPDRATPRGLRDHAMLRLMRATGVDPSELVAFEVGDVDVGARSAIVRLGRHARAVDFDDATAAAIGDYLRDARPVFARTGDSPALFLTWSVRGMTRQGFWKLLRRYAAKAGTAKLTPRSLRRAFAEDLLARGERASDVQFKMGYASLDQVMALARSVLTSHAAVLP